MAASDDHGCCCCCASTAALAAAVTFAVAAAAAPPPFCSWARHPRVNWLAVAAAASWPSCRSSAAASILFVCVNVFAAQQRQAEHTRRAAAASFFWLACACHTQAAHTSAQGVLLLLGQTGCVFQEGKRMGREGETALRSLLVITLESEKAQSFS